MLNFIKEYINLPYLIVYILSITTAYFLPEYIIEDPQNMNFSKFIIIFGLNLISYIILFVYGFKIRLDIDKKNSIQPGRYLATVIVGSLFIGLIVLPFILLFQYFIANILKFDADNLIEYNFIINLIYLPAFYSLFIITTGVYSRILSKMTVNFKIKEVFQFFNPPFIKTIIYSSIIVYILPLGLKLVSCKIDNPSHYFQTFFYYFQMLSFLFETYLVMYLIVLWDLNIIKKTTANSA